MKKYGIHITVFIISCIVACGCLSSKNQNVLTPIPSNIQLLSTHSWGIDSIIFLDITGKDSARYGLGNVPGFANWIVQLYVTPAAQQVYVSYDRTNTSLKGPSSNAIPTGDTTLFLKSYNNAITAMWTLDTAAAPTPDTLFFQTLSGGTMSWVIDSLSDQAFRMRYIDSNVIGANNSALVRSKKVFFRKIATN